MAPQDTRHLLSRRTAGRGSRTFLYDNRDACALMEAVGTAHTACGSATKPNRTPGPRRHGGSGRSTPKTPSRPPTPRSAPSAPASGSCSASSATPNANSPARPSSGPPPRTPRSSSVSASSPPTTAPPAWRHQRQVSGRVDHPVVAPQNTAGESYVPLTGEPEAEGAADAVRGRVRRRRERVHQPPAAIVAGQFEQHPDGPLPEPAALELRQHHPADLRHRLTALIVGPQHHVPGYHVRCGLVRDDHLDPVATPRSRPDVAGHLVLDTLAGQRATQFSHHDRIAPHPHIGIDVAQPGCLPSSTRTPTKRHGWPCATWPGTRRARGRRSGQSASACSSRSSSA